MSSLNSFNPLYGNYQQQYAPIQQNQPTTSFFMQPLQQQPVNFQQQYEVCHVQPASLQQAYNTHFPPLNYQLTNSQQMYTSHLPSPSHQQNAMQAAATSQIDSDNDLEFEYSSDKETQ